MAGEIPKRGELGVTIDYEKPIPAVELGNLIAAMARDYRAASRGRTLTVTRVATGSIQIFFQDAYEVASPYVAHAVEIAKGTKALSDFAKLLRDTFSSLKKGTTSQRSKEGAYRTAQASLKMALEHGADFHFKETCGDVATVEFTVTPHDASTVKEIAEMPIDPAAYDHILKSLPSAQLPTLGIEPFRDMMTAPGVSPQQRATLASAVVSVLKQAGQSHLIFRLIENLERSGLPDLAREVRIAAKMGGGQNNTEPPLLA
jgi:hypothetical protein